MYYKYFGLDEAPFSIAVNPRYLFMSARHRDALAHLIYGVGVGGGFILLTGEVGTGKTTITRCLLEQLPEQTDIAMIFNPALNAVELLAAVCDELGIDYDKGDQSLKGLSDKLHQFLLDNHQRGRNTVLLIDEAQHLQLEVLEQVRLLTNLETNTRKLLQIILVGQPELVTMLARPELRQLSQRITARYQLKAFSLDETGNYIRHRLQVAGLHANQELFPPRVVKYIYQVSGGIPRLINVLCDRILLGTYGQNKAKVDMAMARQAVTEVKGEDDELAHKRTVNKWPIAIAGAVLAAVAVLLWWQAGSRYGSIELWAEPESVGVSDSAPSSGNSSAATIIETEPELEFVAESEALPERELEAVPETEPEAKSETETKPKPVSHLFFDTQATALNYLLLATGAVSEALESPCWQLAKQGWRCELLKQRSWAEFLSFDTPAVLEIRTRGETTTWAALVAVTAEEALLTTLDGDQSISLAQLRELWTGSFMFPWQPPPGYSGPLRTGDEGEAVAWLSRQFARFDGQDRGLADQIYNQQLRRRVMLFQREQSLLVDGAAGLQTLLKIEQKLGDAPTLIIEAAETTGRVLMSLILDALNRAEQERSEKNHIPSLQSVHGSTEQPRPSLLQRLHLERWLIVLVVAYLAYDYFGDRSTLPSVEQASAPVVAADAVPDPAPERAQVPQSEERAALTPAPKPAPATSAPIPLPTAAARSQSTPVVDDKAASPVTSSPEIESLYQTPSQDAASSVVATHTDPLPDNTAAPASLTVAAEREEAYARSKEITQLALGFRQQIPSLKYANHMPSADPAESRVVLNGNAYKEGDEVAPGLLLKGISEAGIVLEFQDTQFRLEAHNSWINFQ